MHCFTYTRTEAIADGVLNDVSEMALEAGITFPVAITAGVAALLDPPVKAVGQSFDGRLWDVLWMFRSAATGMLKPVEQYPVGAGEAIHFELNIVNGPEPIRCGPDPWRVVLKAISGPGDDMEPVITIMLPDED